LHEGYEDGERGELEGMEEVGRVVGLIDGGHDGSNSGFDVGSNEGC
jgi:hypothetical protein